MMKEKSQNQKLSRILIAVGFCLVMVGSFLLNYKKDYFFQEYGFGCVNVENERKGTFEIKEPTKVHFTFYSRAEGEMSVSLKDPSGADIFRTDEINFEEKKAMVLDPGVYSYDINYSGVKGDFELFGAVYKIFGFVF